MIRITVQAPQWAIDAGLAHPGDTDTDLFEDNEKDAIEEFTHSSNPVECQHVNADIDDEMFIRGY